MISANATDGTPHAVPDLYFGAFCDIHRWGGAAALTRSIAESCERFGYSTQNFGASATGDPPDVIRRNRPLNAPSALSRGWWRLPSYRTAARLAAFLRAWPRPRLAFISASMYWTVAAKRVWPDCPVVYFYPCLLANCHPFSWPGRRPPNVWAWLNYRGIRRAERLAFAVADRTIVPTRQSADEIAAFYRPVTARTVQVTYGARVLAGPEVSRTAARAAHGLDNDRFVVLAVGLVGRNKGFDLLLDAGRHTATTDYIVVGEGPDRERLLREAQARGLASRVRFVGSQNDMRTWYAAADVVVSTSHYDTFPNVCLEAMSLARPVLVPEHDPPRVWSGFAEVVRRWGGGWTYARNGADLARVVERLVSTPAEVSATGNAARDLALRHFGWDGCVQAIRAVVGDPPPIRTAATALQPSALAAR